MILAVKLNTELAIDSFTKLSGLLGNGLITFVKTMF